MIILKICFWTVIVTAALFAIAFLCITICEYCGYKKYTLRHAYQKLNAKVFMSTYHLFPDRYSYDWSGDGYIGSLAYTITEPGANKFFPNKKEYHVGSLTYTITEPGSNKFFPNKTKYHILLNFIDYCRVNVFLIRERSAKKNKEIVDRETNAVLEDLQKLIREEIEKAGREIDNAIADVRKHMANS